MRWSRLPPKEEQPWTPWFAWHPVDLGERQYAWLEWVERRRIYPFLRDRTYFYTHRLPEDSK